MLLCVCFSKQCLTLSQVQANTTAIIKKGAPDFQRDRQPVRQAVRRVHSAEKLASHSLGKCKKATWTWEGGTPIDMKRRVVRCRLQLCFHIFFVSVTSLLSNFHQRNLMHWTPGIPFCVMHYAVPLQGMLEAGGRVVPHVGETILDGDGVAM